MMTLPAAVTEYLRLEAEANAAMRGADHRQIIDEVAKKHGLETDVLTEAVLDHSFMGAN